MKKLFYFNLNNVHDIAERSMYQYNHDKVEWFGTINSPEVAALWSIIPFPDYSTYYPVHMVGRPIYDYYMEHRQFNMKDMNSMYRPVNSRIDEVRFAQVIAQIDENVERLKEIKPDIIFIRYYSCFEYFLLYFLDKVKDIPAFKCMGGSDYGADIGYYVDSLLDNDLIDNYHDGYGEKHLASILDGDDIPHRTCNFNYSKDDFSYPDKDIHWVITTLTCDGKCKFCVHNRPFRGTMKTDVNFISDDYVDFVLDKLVYLERNGVKNVNVPGSITFYNKKHLFDFYEKYMSRGLGIGFVDTYFKFDDLDEQTVPMIEDMNFHSIKVGLESIGYETRNILGKTFDNDHVYNVTKLLQKSSVMFKYSLIYNFPFEGYHDLIKNYTFLEEMNIQYVSFNRYELTKDTVIYDECDKYNLVRRESDFGYEYYERVVNKLSNKMVNYLESRFITRNDMNYFRRYYDGTILLYR